jgi:hypothetical protein
MASDRMTSFGLALGLPWLYIWGSGRFVGAGRDAGYLAEQIVHHRAERAMAGSGGAGGRQLTDILSGPRKAPLSFAEQDVRAIPSL